MIEELKRIILEYGEGYKPEEELLLDIKDLTGPASPPQLALLLTTNLKPSRSFRPLGLETKSRALVIRIKVSITSLLLVKLSLGVDA